MFKIVLVGWVPGVDGAESLVGEVEVKSGTRQRLGLLPDHRLLPALLLLLQLLLRQALNPLELINQVVQI